MTREEACQMLQAVGLDSGGLDYDGADDWWTWSITTDELLRIVGALELLRLLHV